MRKITDTLIIDLDNTIFDWFAVWYASFHPVYKKIKEVSGASTEEVEASDLSPKFHPAESRVL